MNRRHKLLKRAVKTLASMLFLMLTCTQGVFAQSPPPSAAPAGAPIDGFVSLLLAAGVGYGIKSQKSKK
jgi:hypothetical protein